MNCYKFNTINKNFNIKCISHYEPAKSVFFHINSTGHYWRNSFIQSVYLLYENTNHDWIIEELRGNKEDDEYNLLETFIKKTSDISNFIGLNSTSFHIPYMESKCKAYGLPSPFLNKEHLDIQKELKRIGHALNISTRLDDLRIFWNFDENVEDIEVIAYSLHLYQYTDIFQGAFDILSSEMTSNNELLIRCKCNSAFIQNIRIKNNEFYMIMEQDLLSIRIHTNEDLVKLYYPNYKDYYYLPMEQTVIHKTLASTIGKEYKEKAKPENCYSLISYSQMLANKPASIKQYLIALFNFYSQKK